MQCDKHPRYVGARPSKTGCERCAIVFEIAELYRRLDELKSQIAGANAAASRARSSADAALYVANYG